MNPVTERIEYQSSSKIVLVTERDVTQLHSFYNTLHIVVETMKSLGYFHDLTSSTNMGAALQKLSDLLKEKWGERKIEIHLTILT